ncbi:DUF3047 domain-containing protein [Bathymodiolus japonicus methanotrophic gill symbiont]|uniref:DUF3047 domain-containing protein n=1 Tax=Bathymodiolus japonicus methanotrophic gill symbiont TaxID=113269 RepID=UPI001C8D15E6|nr:DUF3047 domain-containing protein [Bathymodiolus japonicus methanotrophic gill symbiont]
MLFSSLASNNLSKNQTMSLRNVIIIISLYNSVCNADIVVISHFSNSTLNDWQQKSFKDYTQYQLISLSGQPVLQAKSTATASSLYKEVHVDLLKTPYLNWSWRIEKKLPISNEQSKQGDDFTARIYLILKGKWFFWQTKAINYVWANHSPINSAWENPFAGANVMMIAVRSKNDQTQQWYTEKRNVLADFKTYFGDISVPIERRST